MATKIKVQGDGVRVGYEAIGKVRCEKCGYVWDGQRKINRSASTAMKCPVKGCGSRKVVYAEGKRAGERVDAPKRPVIKTKAGGKPSTIRGNRVTAKDAVTCNYCGEPVTKGDMLSDTDGKYIHPKCLRVRDVAIPELTGEPHKVVVEPQGTVEDTVVIEGYEMDLEVAKKLDVGDVPAAGAVHVHEPKAPPQTLESLGETQGPMPSEPAADVAPARDMSPVEPLDTTDYSALVGLGFKSVGKLLKDEQTWALDHEEKAALGKAVNNWIGKRLADYEHLEDMELVGALLLVMAPRLATTFEKKRAAKAKNITPAADVDEFDNGQG